MRSLKVTFQTVATHTLELVNTVCTTFIKRRWYRWECRHTKRTHAYTVRTQTLFSKLWQTYIIEFGDTWQNEWDKLACISLAIVADSPKCVEIRMVPNCFIQSNFMFHMSPLSYLYTLIKRVIHQLGDTDRYTKLLFKVLSINLISLSVCCHYLI